MKLELLPSKEFKFKLESGLEISGKFGTWAANRLSLKKGWNLTTLMTFMSDTENLTLDDIIQLILCTVEYKWRKDQKGSFPYSDIDACEWLEEFGGIDSELFVKLINHFASDLTDEKKNEPEAVTES